MEIVLWFESSYFIFLSVVTIETIEKIIFVHVFIAEINEYIHDVM